MQDNDAVVFNGLSSTIPYPSNMAANEVAVLVAELVTNSIGKYWTNCRVLANASTPEETRKCVKEGKYAAIFAEDSNYLEMFKTNSDDPNLDDHLFVLMFEKGKLAIMTRNPKLPVVSTIMDSIGTAFNLEEGKAFMANKGKKPEFLN